MISINLNERNSVFSVTEIPGPGLQMAPGLQRAWKLFRDSHICRPATTAKFTNPPRSCWRHMRWQNGRTRRSPNPNAEEVLRDCVTNGERSGAQRIPSWPGVSPPTKAEYICALGDANLRGIKSYSPNKTATIEMGFMMLANAAFPKRFE